MKIAAMAPVAMQLDEPMLRFLLGMKAEERGVTVPEDATLTTRVVTDVLDPDTAMLIAEVEV